MPRGIPRSPPPGVECRPPTTQPQNRQWIRNRGEHRRIRHVAPRNCVEAGGGRAGQDGGCASSKSRGDQSRIMPSFDEELLEEIAGRQAETKAPRDLPPPSPRQQGQGHEISGRRHHRSFARRDLLHKKQARRSRPRAQWWRSPTSISILALRGQARSACRLCRRTARPWTLRRRFVNWPEASDPRTGRFLPPHLWHMPCCPNGHMAVASALQRAKSHGIVIAMIVP